MSIEIKSGGAVSTNELLTLDQVKTRLGMGTAALRAARQNGLPVHYVGRRGFVAGDSLIRWIKSNGRREK